MIKEFILNSGIRAKGNKGIILILYSMPFGRYILKNKIKSVKVSYNKTRKSFIIEPGKDNTIFIEREKENHPLTTLYVTKIIPRYFYSRLKHLKKQIKINSVIKGFISKDELIDYSNIISYTRPLNLKNFSTKNLIKVGCFISVFRNKKGFNYRLTIRHKIFEEIFNKREKINIGRNEIGDFIIRKDKNGRMFNFYKYKNGTPVVYMQVSPELIKKDEVDLFRSGRRCISYKAFLSEKEFNLDISKYFATKSERELAYALIKSGFNIRIPEMRKREGDIILTDYNTQIEVTTTMPRNKENHKNSPHTEGVHINARLCEGFLRVTKGITSYFFVVFHKDWMKYKWVKDLCKSIETHVIPISTDFNNDWAKDVSKQIKKILIK